MGITARIFELKRVAWKKQGGGQNLERRNVELPVFQNLIIANIKIKKIYK